MPEINSPFSNPESQRRVGDPEDIILPGNPRFSIPPIAQRDVDLTIVLQRNFEALSNLTGQISRNLGGTGDLLEKNVQSIDRMANSARRYSNITRQDVEQNRQILEFSEQQAKAKEKIRLAEEKYVTTQGKNVGALRAQLQLADMLDRKGKIRYIDPKTGRPATMDIETYMARSDADRQGIREQMTQQAALSAPQGASLRQALQQLSRGNIGGAIGELAQAAPLLGGAARGTENLGARMQAAGVARMAGGGLGGLISGGGLRALGGLTGLAGEFAFSPAALYFGGRYALGQYQQARSTGMQTGESGFGAAREGFGAELRGVVQGINPFDALSMRAAQAVAKGIQSEGFSGSIRAAWQDSVTDVIKRTGMDSSTALSLMSTAVNNFGESAQEFNENMRVMKDTAHETSLSVKQAAESLQQFQQGFYPKGAAPGAQAVVQPATTLQRAMPQAFRPGRLTIGPAIQQNWQRLVARAGLNPADAYTKGVLDQMSMILDKNGKMLWDLKNSNPVWAKMKVDEWVPYMEGRSPGIFEVYLGPGATAQDVIGFMHAVGPGGGGLEHIEKASVAPSVRKAKADTQWYPKGADRGGNLGMQRQIYISQLREKAKDDDLTPAQVRQLAQPIWQSSGKDLTEAFHKSEALLKQFEESKKTGRTGLRQPHPQTAQYGGAETTAAQANRIWVDLTPDARKILKISEQTEPGSRQRYFDSRRGTAATYGMVRP